jgi:site-specific DNA-methyltransferase (adenine-specific)
VQGYGMDNCFGSGSTLVAAVNTNRNYIGFELEPKYYNIACERLYAATTPKAS